MIVNKLKLIIFLILLNIFNQIAIGQNYYNVIVFESTSNNQLESRVNVILSTATYEKPAFDESLKQKVQFILSTDKKFHFPCEPIIINASYSNISENVIRFNRVRDILIEHRKISLVKENNEDAALTRYGEATLGKLIKHRVLSSSAMTEFILPNNSAGYAILINRIFDMTQSGVYKINLTKTFYDNDNNTYCDVTSNTLEVTILEDVDNHPVFRYIPPPPVDSSVWDKFFGGPPKNNSGK